MGNNNGAGTAIATRPQAPSDKEIEAIRSRGSVAVAHQRELKMLAAQIEGMEWGSGTSAVKGTSLSPATRYAFAEFCKLTRANPLMHVDILGGKPYLNASYWMDRINTDPAFHDYVQRDISPSVEAALRERAARHRELAANLPEPEASLRLGKALDLEEEADDLALARAKWSAPEWATVVIETTIRRFSNVAPLDAIRAGDVEDFERYLVAFHECNWAGGRPEVTKKRKDGSTYTYDPDPIGNEEPAKTARTRSLRRAARTAFPAWMAEYDQQIRKAEGALEAEFEVIREDGASVPAFGSSGVPAAQLGSGEPAAAAGADAEDDPELARARAGYEEACGALGVEPGKYAATTLLRMPASAEDYQQLTRKLSAEADAEAAAEAQGDLLG